MMSFACDKAVAHMNSQQLQLSAQNKIIPVKSSTDWGAVHETPPLLEELLTS